MSSNSEGRRAAFPSTPNVRGLTLFFLKRLVSLIQAGRITIVTPSGQRIDHQGPEAGPEAVLVLHRWRALVRLMVGGDLAFAEAYINGDWSSPDLARLIELGAKNLGRLDNVIAGSAPIGWFNRFRHALRANTKTGSRRNIAFHYDLGNSFYRLWLDGSMTYSSALYKAPTQTLEDAQEEKLARIVELLEPPAGGRILEIGCGWGTLAARLARGGGAVTGLTLSSEQLEYAQSTFLPLAPEGALEFRLQDYRDVEGEFDRIVSIEMLEAVGERYWPAYFKTLRDRLKTGGRAVLQVITIDERRYAHYSKNADFIQRYVFPGGMLPSKTILAEQASRAGLRLLSAEAFGESYAETLVEWRQRFIKAWPEIERLGFPMSFRRLWEYYLCYCEAGFRAGEIDVGLYCLEK